MNFWALPVTRVDLAAGLCRVICARRRQADVVVASRCLLPAAEEGGLAAGDRAWKLVVEQVGALLKGQAVAVVAG